MTDIALIYCGILLTIKLQHLPLLEPSLQVVVDVDGSDSCWSASVEDVASLQGEEP